MRKIVLVLFITLLSAGMAAAQGWDWGNQGWGSQPLTVSGTLQLQNGTIAVVNGNTVYYVPTLERYIGFIEALKEGAQVSLEGYAGPNNYMQAVKLTIGGKTYDLVASGPQGMAYNGSRHDSGNNRMGRGTYGHSGNSWCH